MKYRYFLVDVFSAQPFGGNQLAVLPDARGLGAADMQRIAREFNFSESTFVLPPEDPRHTHRVRIFTPRTELPFAGHPTVGTASALAMHGLCGAGNAFSLVFEEGVGPVKVDVREQGGTWSATLTLETRVEQPPCAVGSGELAAVLSLQPAEVQRVFFAGVGVPLCFAQLANRAAVDRAMLDRGAWSRHLAQTWGPSVFLFEGELKDGAELYARMFAPAMGIEEDPATGSACAALAGATVNQPSGPETIAFNVIQGVAMGRRSEISAGAGKLGGGLTSVSVGGATALVASGEMEIDGSSS